MEMARCNKPSCKDWVHIGAKCVKVIDGQVFCQGCTNDDAAQPERRKGIESNVNTSQKAGAEQTARWVRVAAGGEASLKLCPGLFAHENEGHQGQAESNCLKNSLTCRDNQLCKSLLDPPVTGLPGGYWPPGQPANTDTSAAGAAAMVFVGLSVEAATSADGDEERTIDQEEKLDAKDSDGQAWTEMQRAEERVEVEDLEKETASLALEDEVEIMDKGSSLSVQTLRRGGARKVKLEMTYNA